MINRLTSQFDFNAEALKMRSERQRAIASNIANADTPGFQARDFDFPAALRAATGAATGAVSGSGGQGAMATTNDRHMPVAVSPSNSTAGSQAPLLYRLPTQAAFDGNTVDIDREKANFAENSVRYEASLRFLNGQMKAMSLAVTGQ